MRRFFICLALLVAPLAGPVAAQPIGWGDLDAQVLQLSPTGSMEASFFLPDTPDPATAQRALAVVYAHIPGSAGSVSIHAGLFARAGTGWSLVTPVRDLFGQSPENPVFTTDRMELTTLMPGPNDPRCCPTLRVRWSISLVTGQAIRLN